MLLGRTWAGTVNCQGFLRWWDANWQTVSISPSPFSAIPSSSRLPVHQQLFEGTVSNEQHSSPCQLSGTHCSAPLSFAAFFCLCNIYDAISHTPLHYSHYEGSTIKCWCHNFHIINNMMSNGTVPFCCKHGTVHPSWLNHPLPSPTTDPSNVTQTSESTFRHMQHFIVVLAAISFIFNRLFHTLLHTPRCCRMFHPQQGLKIHLAKNTGYCGKLLSNVVGTSVLPSSRSIHGRLSAQLRCVTHFHYGTLSHLLSVK